MEFSKTVELLVRTSPTNHVSKIAHGIKILPISKLNFSLHVDVAEFSLYVDLLS